MAATTISPIHTRTFGGSDGDSASAVPIQVPKREQSREVLAAALKSERLTPEAKEAFALALSLIKEEWGSANGGDPKKPDDDDDEPDSAKTTIGAVADVVGALPPTLVKRAVVTLAVALALVQPLVSNFAGVYFGSSTQLTEKLDEIIVNQSEDRAANAKRDRNMATMSAFVVRSEQARRAGTPPPPIPAMLTLMAAQDEVERTSGN